MSLSYECFVLSGTGPCNGPITRPEEMHRLCVSLIVIRYKNNPPQHNTMSGQKDQTKQERNKEYFESDRALQSALFFNPMLLPPSSPKMFS
jgi:hypothetical protein